MQSVTPLVSIITPVFRCADTLAVALDSLARQDESRWESIVVDDGSPDNSYDIVNAYANADQRFRVLRQQNAGACAARNTALAVAKGRYVLFLDADDWMEPGAISAMVSACEKKRLGAVHGTFRYAKPDGRFTKWTGAYDGRTPLFDALSDSNVLSLPSSVMLRRSLLDEIGGGFDESLAHCGDWDLWARVARSDIPIGRIDTCVTGYRMRPSSLSRNPLTLLRDAQSVLTRIHGRDPRVKRPQRHLAAGANATELPARLANFTFYAAALAMMQGRPDAATLAMDTLPHWPMLAPRRIAEFLLHAACFSRCVAPDDLRPLPGDVHNAMDRIVEELAHRTQASGLNDRVVDALGELGFDRRAEAVRAAELERLLRPRTALDTLASEYLRSLALRECGAAHWAGA